MISCLARSLRLQKKYFSPCQIMSQIEYNLKLFNDYDMVGISIYISYNNGFLSFSGSNVIPISIFQFNWTEVKQYLPKQTVDKSSGAVKENSSFEVSICFMFKLLTTDHLPSKRCGKENENSNLLRRNFPRVRMFIVFYLEQSILLRSGDSDILNKLLCYYRVSRRQSMHEKGN